MPRDFASGSAIHDYFQRWMQVGLFPRYWQLALDEYDDLNGIDRTWQSLDGAITLSPLCREYYRAKPDQSRQALWRMLGAD